MSDAIEGIRVDGLPNVPRIRRTIPDPHRRPGIAIATSRIKREWRTVAPDEVHPGDTVPGLGTVHSVRIDHRTGIVTYQGGQDNSRTLGPDERVWAFARVKSPTWRPLDP